jgi:hypothetical protein
MENPDLRKAMGMKPDQKGVRVRRVEPTAPESGCLQPSDIILSFDGIDIANDGTGMAYLHLFQLCALELGHSLPYIVLSIGPLYTPFFIRLVLL